jgi:UDP-GlcNAc:undecaprenyl-phosphate/decaprenyl-phosphate GlcNAc-1-phosphate transferase
MTLCQKVVVLDPARLAPRAGTALLAAVAARLGLAALRRRPPGGSTLWERTNHAGRAVSRLGGPALVLGATAAALTGGELPVRARTALVAGVLGAGAVGVYDDLCETRRGATAKGIRGHLRASAEGRLTSGALKVVGLSAVGALAAAPISPRRLDTIVGGAVLAGYANVANLLDLRPGRCLKFGLVHAPLAGLAGPPGAAAVGILGAAAALLPADLREEVMLGDCGANALGAALGVAVLLRYGLLGRLAHLVSLAILTAASERVSFTEVIAGNPVLHRLDSFGRRPAPALRTSD